MDPSQLAAISSSTAAPIVPSCTPTAGQLSSSASVLQWPQHTDVGHGLLNPDNTPLLPSSSAEATAASAVAIVSLSHTHQIISLKLTNTNYLYWRM